MRPWKKLRKFQDNNVYFQGYFLVEIRNEDETAHVVKMYLKIIIQTHELLSQTKLRNYYVFFVQ